METDNKILKIITEESGIKLWQAEAVTELIDSGCTIPFIARYRKEATGAMDDEALRNFDERLRYLRNLEDRKKTVLSAIEEQGKLTDELRVRIEDASTAVMLEDLYRPYKPKERHVQISPEKRACRVLRNTCSPEMQKMILSGRQKNTFPKRMRYLMLIPHSGWLRI